MTQESSAKVSLYHGSFSRSINGNHTARNRPLFASITDYAWRIKYNSIKYSNDHWCYDLWRCLRSIICGPISDIMGRKMPLVVGNLLCVISSIICAYAPSIEILLLGRFLQGLTGSVGVVISKAIARDFASGQELTKLFALLMMVNGLAPVIAPLVGGQLLLFTTWRVIFIILAVFLCYSIARFSSFP